MNTRKKNYTFFIFILFQVNIFHKFCQPISGQDNSLLLPPWGKAGMGVKEEYILGEGCDKVPLPGGLGGELKKRGLGGEFKPGGFRG